MADFLYFKVLVRGFKVPSARQKMVPPTVSAPCVMASGKNRGCTGNHPFAMFRGRRNANKIAAAIFI
jgi:hypothetical protein